MICSKLTMYSDTYTYADLFKQPNMRKISLLSILQLMLIACIFDASIRNITNLRSVKLSNRGFHHCMGILLSWLKVATSTFTLNKDTIKTLC